MSNRDLSDQSSMKEIKDFVGHALKRRDDQKFKEVWQRARHELRVLSGSSTLTNYLRVEDYLDLSERYEIEEFSRLVEELAHPAFRSHQGHLARVEVLPWTEVDGSWRSGTEHRIEASTREIAEIWSEGTFRLFISHSSIDKAIAKDISTKLSKLRVHGFVAHEDIEPSARWRRVIENALASCHAVLLLSSENSNESAWCNQEVGWAYGRGLLISSYKLKIDQKRVDPRGFANDFQAWSVENDDLIGIRDSIFDQILKDDRTEPHLREPLVTALASATHKQARYFAERLQFVKSLTSDQAHRVSKALELPAISTNKDTSELLRATIQRLGFPEPDQSQPDQVVSAEYDPFAED